MNFRKMGFNNLKKLTCIQHKENSSENMSLLNTCSDLQDKYDLNQKRTFPWIQNENWSSMQ